MKKLKLSSFDVAYIIFIGLCYIGFVVLFLAAKVVENKGIAFYIAIILAIIISGSILLKYMYLSKTNLKGLFEYFNVPKIKENSVLSQESSLNSNRIIFDKRFSTWRSFVEELAIPLAFLPIFLGFSDLYLESEINKDNVIDWLGFLILSVILWTFGFYTVLRMMASFILFMNPIDLDAKEPYQIKFDCKYKIFSIFVSVVIAFLIYLVIKVGFMLKPEMEFEGRVICALKEKNIQLIDEDGKVLKVECNKKGLGNP